MITLLYATVSGKTEQLAKVACDRLLALGWQAQAFNVANYPIENLTRTDILLFITSSWGDGAPPPDAVEFFHAVEAPRLRLPHLSYSVLALGSLANRMYIGSGWRIDAALEARGARRLLPRRECERDDREGFERWLITLLQVLSVNELLFTQELKLA